uniref:Putative secreted protein n=1 Tax=Anopheles darlingi TaxID=43151 RepID=A0A2M4DJZ9_ANODA
MIFTHVTWLIFVNLGPFRPEAAELPGRTSTRDSCICSGYSIGYKLAQSESFVGDIKMPATVTHAFTLQRGR